MSETGTTAPAAAGGAAGREPRIAVVLPAYNEAQTVADTVRAFAAALPGAAVWVIDNNSSDGTGELAAAAVAAAGCPGGVIREERQGKGNAVRRAFLDIDADAYVLADADTTYPADAAPALLTPVLAGRADLVVGDRLSGGHYAAENKRPLHEFGNNLVRRLVNRLFRASLADIMSGYRVLSRRFAKSYPILVEGFEIETEMTLHALDKRFRILEIPVEYRDRPPGSMSKLDTFRDGARVINTITRILRYYRPLVFFGGAALLFALLGIAAGVPPVLDWLRHRWVYHVPLAILATGLEIVAIVLAAIGLLLDSITHQARLAFERELLRHRD